MPKFKAGGGGKFRSNSAIVRATKKALEAAQLELRARADRACRAIALEATGRIVLRTPVDTGRARGNWQGYVGESVLKEYDLEKKDKAGTTTVNAALTSLSNFGVGKKWWITNGLPYIGVLEHGSSKQAPTGMIAVTVKEMQTVATQVAQKIKKGTL